MALFGFHRRGRDHERDRERERRERQWAENRSRDWGERRYHANERSHRDRDTGDYYGQQRYGANPYERPEEFGQNRGDWHNDWRAEQEDYGLDPHHSGRGFDRDRDDDRQTPNDRWQQSYNPHASRRSSYRGSTNEGYGDFQRGREPGTHGAYWSPERTDFSDFGRGGDVSGGELSSYGAGQYPGQYSGQHRGRGPKGYRRSDDRLREDACECLTDDDRIDATNVEVNVKECEVTLTGTVNSREEKRRAEDLIDRLSGVRDIHNQLRVVNEGGLVEGPQSRQSATEAQSAQTTNRGQGSRH